jgi:hypothetical protein
LQIDYRLSHAEMLEAYRLNLTPKFWLRVVWANLRAIVLIAFVLFGAAIEMAHGKGHNWEAYGVLLAVALVLILLYLWRLIAVMKKSAARLNESCARMTLDPQGISTASVGGATTFTPWQQYNRWREGKLVFTVSNKKLFRTIPKSALTTYQVDEVRGLLQSQVRSA